ncbi:MAG TPA: PTS fructose transporter subunit IIA [Burkholderiaceae bacterium]|nr:PTS fructose transporter subunit IIA [Burkholderiaceae bacterium]
MASLLIVAHAPLASAMKAVAGHAFPELDATMLALDVGAGDAPEQVEARVRALLAASPEPEVLILTDVFGATPCNAALRVADGQRSRVVAGLNVPMLWRALCYRAEALDSLVARAVGGATQGVMQVAIARPQNQSTKPNPDDQEQHHHQQ